MKRAIAQMLAFCMMLCMCTGGVQAVNVATSGDIELLGNGLAPPWARGQPTSAGQDRQDQSRAELLGRFTVSTANDQANGAQNSQRGSPRFLATNLPEPIRIQAAQVFHWFRRRFHRIKASTTRFGLWCRNVLPMKASRCPYYARDQQANIQSIVHGVFQIGSPLAQPA